MPAPSCPKIAGNRPSGSAPERVNSSVWHTPDALISTSTSPSRGPSRSRVITSRGLPAARATAARVFMSDGWCYWLGTWDCPPSREAAPRLKAQLHPEHRAFVDRLQSQLRIRLRQSHEGVVEERCDEIAERHA